MAQHRVKYIIDTMKEEINEHHNYDITKLSEELGVSKRWLRRLLRQNLMGQELEKVERYETVLKRTSGRKFLDLVENKKVFDPAELSWQCNITYEQVLAYANAIGGKTEKVITAWETLKRYGLL